MLDRNGLEILDRDESLRLLGTAKVGRVGVATDAMPVVLPVNFVLDGDRVVFRSAPGTKLYVALSNAVVAFEADDVDTDYRWGWSVCVSGPARILSSPDEVERASTLGLRPWAGLGDDSYVVIDSDVVTGRRLRRGGADATAGVAS